MKIVVACGGTGGHAFPGLAVAEELKSRGHQVVVWDSGRDVESSVMRRWTGDIFSTGAKQLKLRNAFAILRSIFRCKREMKRSKPDVLLAMGSYASLPPVMAAHKCGVPVVLHEANTVPGRAVEFLSRYAKAVATSFDMTAKYLPGAKTVKTGLPIRSDIASGKRFPSIPEGAFTVFVTGGSQGAHAVNCLMSEALAILSNELKRRGEGGRKLYVIHQTGEKDEGAVIATYMKAGVDARVHAFENEMANAFASADIVVARAGASTCFELAACGKPALFIPLPSALRNHQHFNAESFTVKRAADEGKQSELTAHQIAEYLLSKCDRPESLAAMAAQMKGCATPDAAEKVADLVEASARKSRAGVVKAAKVVSAIAISLLSLAAAASPTVSKPEDVAKLIPHETKAEKDARMAWWTEGRFGMFIHFGLYAMPARHEWVKTYERIPDEKYQVYFENFNPDLFDAKKWARSAKEAGMKYVVLTAKHHEGFCLWDTKATGYKITNTPFGRDLLKEYVEALRAEGLKVGFYYSLIDWHHPDFTVDQHHPMRGDESEATYARLNEGRDMARYRKFLVDQVTELLTGYGKIDIIWFDFSYPGAHGKSRDDWDSPALLALARKLQPGIIVDNRMDMNDVPDGCDFITPEQFKVTAWPRLNGEKFPWETCQTFSGSWGYHRDESSWKSTKQCLQLLIDAVSHGGNLIMNVGPTGRGEFDSRAEERLSAFGRWMHFNSRAIYGCTEPPEEFETPEGCVMTWNPKTKRLYLHVYSYPSSGAIGIRFADRVKYAQFLHDGSEIPVKGLPDWQKANDPGAFTEFCMMPAKPPEVEIPVIELFIK